MPPPSIQVKISKIYNTELSTDEMVAQSVLIQESKNRINELNNQLNKELNTLNELNQQLMVLYIQANSTFPP